MLSSACDGNSKGRFSSRDLTPEARKACCDIPGSANLLQGEAPGPCKASTCCLLRRPERWWFRCPLQLTPFTSVYDIVKQAMISMIWYKHRNARLTLSLNAVESCVHQQRLKTRNPKRFETNLDSLHTLTVADSDSFKPSRFGIRTASQSLFVRLII